MAQTIEQHLLEGEVEVEIVRKINSEAYHKLSINGLWVADIHDQSIFINGRSITNSEMAARLRRVAVWLEEMGD